MALVDRYVPAFLIKVGRMELRYGIPYTQKGATVDVLSVTVTDTVNQADSFSFTVRDRHPERGHFAGGPELKWIDSGIFDEGTDVKIEMGYQSKPSEKDTFDFEGEITAVSASFPESGVPTLVARGFSFFHHLQRRSPRKPFEARTDSGIAQEIADAMGWGYVVDETVAKRPILTPKNQTYAAILTSRAQRIGYEVAVKKKTLIFEEPRYRQRTDPELTLEWGKDLRSFSPNLSTYNMVPGVAIRGSQTARGMGKTPLVGTATAKDIRGKMGDKTGLEIAPKIKEWWDPKPTLDEDHDVVDQDEAKEVALAKLEGKALEFISGRGSIIGTPQLKARMLIELKGLGRRFSGNYYVTSVTHTIDAGGYRTDFEVKRNARNETR